MVMGRALSAEVPDAASESLVTDAETEVANSNGHTTMAVTAVEMSTVTAVATGITAIYAVRVVGIAHLFDVVPQVVQRRFHGPHQSVDMAEVAMRVSTETMSRVVFEFRDNVFQVVEQSVRLGQVAFQVMNTAVLMRHFVNVGSRTVHVGRVRT